MSTARLVRTSHSVPGLIDRQSSSDWERSGSKTMGERAYTKAMEILNNHNPCGLREDVVTLVNEIAGEGEKKYWGNKGRIEIGVTIRNGENDIQKTRSPGFKPPGAPPIEHRRPSPRQPQELR